MYKQRRSGRNLRKHLKRGRKDPLRLQKRRRRHQGLEGAEGGAQRRHVRAAGRRRQQEIRGAQIQTLVPEKGLRHDQVAVDRRTHPVKDGHLGQKGKRRLDGLPAKLQAARRRIWTALRVQLGDDEKLAPGKVARRKLTGYLSVAVQDRQK